MSDLAVEQPIYTCYTCGVGYNDSESQRSHYKSDWHRYNLKRKVALLSPITEDVFMQKVNSQPQSTTTERIHLWCDTCRKRFSSQKSYENHLQSHRHYHQTNKHAQNVRDPTTIEKHRNTQTTAEDVNSCLQKKVKDTVLVEETSKSTDDSESDNSSIYEGEALGVEECLFCGYINATIEENVCHMTTDHSFFIPDAEYLVDIEGFLSYLGAKVGEGHLCLWCNETGKRFHSTRAAQQHMVDKGHCKIRHEGETLLEYSDFYDYSSSYPDENSEFDEEVDTDDGIALSTEDGYELVLPSGATVGHRSLFRYYKQNVPEKRISMNRRVLPNILHQYKALGWTGTSGPLAVKKAADIKFMLRAKRRYELRVGIKANKLQHHFRDPNGMIR